MLKRVTFAGFAFVAGMALAPMFGQGRPTPPARDPLTPGYPAATELADGRLPPSNADGNFILGPTHTSVSESLPQAGVPQGSVF